MISGYSANCYSTHEYPEIKLMLLIMLFVTLFSKTQDGIIDTNLQLSSKK